MQDAAATFVPAQNDDRNDNHRSIVSDLMSLVEHVEAIKRLIEATIASEPPLEHQETDAGDEIVVLDDVTPRYIEASTALDVCRAGLGVALDLMMVAETSERGTDASVGCDIRPLRFTGRA